MTRATRLAPLLGLVAALACQRHPAPASDAVARLRTTDGTIAMGNLDVQIATAEQRLSSNPQDVAVAASLVDLILTRAQVTASTSDLERAVAFADRASQAPGGGGRAKLVRAAVHAALHRFGDALRDLEAAEREGADALVVRSQRAAVLNAQGRLEEALALRRELASARRTITTLGQLAITEAALGDPTSAMAHLQEALAAYRDTSPVPVAWIEFQRGRIAELAGDLDAASRAYAAAVGRLPQYAEAAGHLAALEALRGRTARAEALLRPLVTPERDPQYALQLASVLDARGAGDEAARLREEARSRYDRLLSRRPEAYADHAARLLLGSDPARALALAEANLDVRQTWEAYDLALAAARAASAAEEGCRVATDALARPSPPDRIRLAARRALEGCRAGAARSP